MKPIYTAMNAEAARTELDTFTDSELGGKYPTAVKTFQDAWERFIPCLAFPPELRCVINTTNSIESLNYQLRKVTKSRGHFPNDDAVVKLLWLAICNIEDKRVRAREKEKKEKGGSRGTSQSRRTTRRGPDNHKLETSPRPVIHGLSRPNQPTPINREPAPLTQKT